jgi:hypothetical protein
VQLLRPADERHPGLLRVAECERAAGILGVGHLAAQSSKDRRSRQRQTESQQAHPTKEWLGRQQKSNADAAGILVVGYLGRSQQTARNKEELRRELGRLSTRHICTTPIQLLGSAMPGQAQLHNIVAASCNTHPEQAVNAVIWHFWPEVSRQVRERVKRVVVPASTVSKQTGTDRE